MDVASTIVILFSSVTVKLNCGVSWSKDQGTPRSSKVLKSTWI